MRNYSAGEETWLELAQHQYGETERFDLASLHSLPAPARRWLTRAIPDRTPLSPGVVLTMKGEIRIGRWMPFTAEQIIRPGVGFVWRPVVGGRILRFLGADIFSPRDARMEFKWQGVIPVARASGPDTARSATGRLAAEIVAWLPQAATPQAGARWTPVDDETAVVSLNAAGSWTDIEVSIDDDGRLRAVRLDRWNTITKPSKLQPFGGEIDGEFVTADGVRIAGSGAIGWGFRTATWPEGEFFRFSITSAYPLE